MIGMASPNPSGIPGFNEGWVSKAGVGGGSVNAAPLPSWYNVIKSVLNANDSLSLPPAAPGMMVTVVNDSGQLLGSTANTAVVFGNTNTQGVQDTIAGATGAQGTTGVALAANSVGLFWVITPQVRFTSSPLPGSWQYKVLT